MEARSRPGTSMAAAARLAPLLLAAAIGALVACGDRDGKAVGHGSTPQPAGRRGTSASPADEAIEACLRATYALGREGVRRASCDVRATWDRRYFREPIEFGGRFEFNDGKAAVEWKEREGDPELVATLARLFEPDWLRSDLAGATLAVVPGAASLTLAVSGTNPLHATSLTFRADGTLATAEVRAPCGGVVERDGTCTFRHETRNGRRHLVEQRARFGDACTDETVIRWEEHEGLLLPAEIRRHVAAGKGYDDERFELVGWSVKVEPAN